MSPSKHARDAARARAERQAAKRAAAQRRKRKTQAAVAGTVVGVLLLALAVSLLTGNDKKAVTTTVSQPTPLATSTTPTSPGTCTYKKSGSAAKDVGTPSAPTASKEKTATLDTSVGTIAFTLNATKAPCTTNSFDYLAAKDYFNNTTCHRLTTQGIFVLQCGDPTATGSGGPGYAFADENLTGLGTAAGEQATYPAGTVAMANSGPGTNGSQFFLVYKDSPLAANYTPFGQITQGLDLINKVADAGVEGGGADGKPKTPVTIKTFAVN